MSCEANVYGEDTWTVVGSLPAAVTGVRGVNIDNRVLMIGNQIILHQNL